MLLRTGRRRQAARCLAPLLLIAAAGCGGGGGNDDRAPADYLSPELRAAVEQLEAEVAASPTDETTIAGRARVLADWVDAYALGGGEVGLEGPGVRLHATLPPTGAEALREGATVDRLVRQFALHDEPGALGELGRRVARPVRGADAPDHPPDLDGGHAPGGHRWRLLGRAARRRRLRSVPDRRFRPATATSRSRPPTATRLSRPASTWWTVRTAAARLPPRRWSSGSPPAGWTPARR